jgi:hypothetical protein
MLSERPQPPIVEQIARLHRAHTFLGRQGCAHPCRGKADSSQQLGFQATVPCDRKYILAAGRRAVPQLQQAETISAPSGSRHGRFKLGSPLPGQVLPPERQPVKVLLAEDIALIRGALAALIE